MPNRLGSNRGMRILRKIADRWLRGRAAKPHAASSSVGQEAAHAEFALDVTVPAQLEADGASVGGLAAVQVLPHLAHKHGIVLRPGTSLATPTIRSDAPPTLRLSMACAPGTGPAVVHVERRSEPGGSRVRLASFTVDGRSANEWVFELATNGTGDDGCHRYWLTAAGDNPGPVVITGMLLGEAHRLGRLHAFASYAHCLKNEVQNFSGAAYTHRMYGESAGSTASRGVAAATSGGSPLAARDRAAELAARVASRVDAMPPQPGEVAFQYAMRLLGAVLPMQPPDFLNRANLLGGEGTLRILSLCAGAARIEELILKHSRRPIRMTLLDASRDLIERAAGRLAEVDPRHSIDCLVGDVNDGLPGDAQFDVVVCVSALHHVADLERVLADVNGRLDGVGEFWSIGEQIGRNGNRLWPDTLSAANRAFARLPASLRRNRRTGEIDATLSDQDFSIGCFEGIRSQELEGMLEAHFIPVDLFKRNCFLWRIVDMTYADNFDLAKADDAAWLRHLVAAEAAHWACGGRATELHGIYRKKTVQ